MSWLGLLLAAIGIYLAYKLIGAFLKIAMLVLALVGLYWFAAPHLGLPSVSDLFYVLGPDFEGRRIEEVASPKNLGKQATDGVVDAVVEQFKSAVSPLEGWQDGRAKPPAPEQLPQEPQEPQGAQDLPVPPPRPSPQAHDPARVH